MKSLPALMISALLPIHLFAAAEPPIVPRPVEWSPGTGEWVVKPGSVAFRTSPALAAEHGPESYRIRVTTKGSEVESGGEAGRFYATQTLMQLEQNRRLPAGEILDYPRFAWRGFMLDVSRHFAPPAQVKKLLDAMASYKLNTFHWHLSDDQGWRIEIPGYPELTRKGAWRGAGEAVPAWKEDGSDARYGGFYTVGEIREIVAYAAARHITIVPEIDVPGHSYAAAAAHPEILCTTTSGTRSVQGVSGNVWCVGREDNYVLLDHIIGEMRKLFPGPYFHIGGDEVNQNAWRDCPRCRARMQEKGLTQVGQLQNDFVRRMEKIVTKHGFAMLGWNEILHGGELDPATVIMSWTGTGPGYDAARRGLRVVMAPGPHCYFDMKENAQDSFGHSWAGIVSLPKVYAFDPLDGGGLTPEQQAKIVGVQACLWAEYLTAPERQDQKAWPRLCALAEVGWTPQPRRDFTNFMERLGPQLERLAARGIGYRMPEAAARVEQGKVVIVPPFADADVRYTLDGTEPAADAARWAGQPLAVEHPADFRTRAFGPGGRTSLVTKGVGRAPARRDGALKPKVSAESTLPVYADHAPAHAADWDEKTFFWSSAKGRKGEMFTLVFEEPVKLASVEWPTGKLDDPTADIVIDGTLEVSADGAVFERAAGFAYGAARAELNGRTVKALRVVLNADQETWVVVQDPILR